MAWVSFGTLRQVIDDEQGNIIIENTTGVEDLADMTEVGNTRFYGFAVDDGETGTNLYNKANALTGKSVEVETNDSSNDYTDEDAVHWFSDIRAV